MAMETSDLSVADVMALQNRDGDGFGGQNFLWFILLIFFFGLGGNGFGWGNRAENCATTEDVQNQFNFAALERQNNETVAAIKDGTYNTVTNAKDLAYNVLGQVRDIESMVAQNGYELSQCCCTTNRNIDSVKFENEKNICAIVNAIRSDGEATRALMTQNTIQELRDKLQDAKIYASNNAQTTEILNSIGRYVTNPPCPTPYYGCGCSCAI